MACKITYKGIRYNSLEELYADAYKNSKSLGSTEQDLNQQQVKPGVEELFESNPELANAVYEALGLNKKSNTVRLYRIENKNIPYDESREGIVSKKEIIGGFFTDNVDTLANHIRKNQSQEGINLVYVDISKSDLDKYHVSKNEYAKNMDVESDNWIIPSDINRSYVDLSSVSKVTGNFMTLSKAKQEVKSIIDSLPTSQITPQQKQQALQQYSQYLDTIFPDSKVKDIVYHGSPNTKIESFLSPEKEGYKKQETTTTGVAGIYFSNKKEVANLYQDFKKEGVKGRTYPAVINTKRPLVVGDKVTDGFTEGTFGASTLWNIQKGVLQGLRKAGIDAIKTGEYASKTSVVGENVEIAVFEPEQIHILGSKQDIEGFKQFVNQPTKKSKTIDPSQLKQIEHQILAYLAENPDATYDGALEALVRSGDLNLDCSM